MIALELLHSIETRGGTVTLKTAPTGAVTINVAPRSLALDLMPDLRRSKPALIELLSEAAEPPPNRWPFAPPRILREAHARGVETTSYGWPVSYWSGDYPDTSESR